jgi:hypothetical protein
VFPSSLAWPNESLKEPKVSVITSLIVDFTNDLMRDFTNGRIFNNPKKEILIIPKELFKNSSFLDH